MKNAYSLLLCLFFATLASANMPPNGFSQFKSKYFVETGTHTGHGVEQALAAGFPIIHSIEISNKLAYWTANRFKNHQNVHIWQGDSGSILYDVIKNINEPITFWLDANSYSQDIATENTPILRELEQIKRHPIKTHTIIINRIGRDAETRFFNFISKDYLIEKIKDINPDYTIRYIAGGDNAEGVDNILVAQAAEYHSPYLDSSITHKIDNKEVNLILEIGTFEGLDTIQLHKYYKCPVISFECAPQSIKKARSAIENYAGIKLVEKAAWNATQKINFYYCSDHPGSSSCYFFDYQAMANRDGISMHQMVKKYQIRNMKVNATRLDEWLQDNSIDQIDMICMSSQGSALPILEGLGSYLHKVKYVVTQMMYQRIYKDEALFPEINKFMEEHGFKAFNADPNGFFNYVIFVRNDLCR